MYRQLLNLTNAQKDHRVQLLNYCDHNNQNGETTLNRSQYINDFILHSDNANFEKVAKSSYFLKVHLILSQNLDYYACHID